LLLIARNCRRIGPATERKPCEVGEYPHPLGAKKRTDFAIGHNGQQKSDLSLDDIEREWLRKKLYLNGTGQLLEWDHTKGSWRSDDHAWTADTNNK
jgi:hypothetical protein